MNLCQPSPPPPQPPSLKHLSGVPGFDLLQGGTEREKMKNIFWDLSQCHEESKSDRQTTKTPYMSTNTLIEGFCDTKMKKTGAKT